MVQKAISEFPIKLLRNVGNYQSWKAPSIDVAGSQVFRQIKEDESEGEEEQEKSEELITAEELQAIKDQAYTEGFEKGRSDGLSSAQDEILKKRLLLTNLIEELENPLKLTGEQTQNELLELSFAIARQIVRRELKQDPTQLIAIIRESLQQLPVGSKEICISLHPDDASIIKEALSINSISTDQTTESASTNNSLKTNNAAEKSWVLLEDPSMQPGGCIIKTSNSKIDASINQQIAILFSQMIDEQRTAEIREPDSAANTNEE